MRILLFFTISAIIFAVGESVQCYNCVEISEGEFPGFQKCVKPFSINDSNPKCTVRGYCMKGFTSKDDMSVTVRQCMSGTNPSVPAEPMEIQVGSAMKATIHFCETDLCNGASPSTTATSFAILLLTTLFFS